MKRIKRLCAIIGSTALLVGSITTTTFGEEQRFKIPEYDLKNAVEEKTELPLSNGSKFVNVVYKLDRNKDGEPDLIESRYLFYYSNKETKPVQIMKALHLNDDFDKYFDRILRDLDGDNYYDEEQAIHKPVGSVY